MPGLLLTALYRIICIHASRNTFLCRAADAHTSLCSITYRVAALRDDTPIFRPQEEKVAVATATDGTAEVEEATPVAQERSEDDQRREVEETSATEMIDSGDSERQETEETPAAEVVSSEEGEMSEVEGAPAAEPASNSDSKRSEAEVEEVSGTGNGQDDSKGTLSEGQVNTV